MTPNLCQGKQVRILTLAPLIGLLALTACANANQSSTPSAEATSGQESQASAQATAGESSAAAQGSGVTCDYPAEGEPARAVDPPPSTNVPNSGEVKVILELSAGNIEITMDRAKAPCTVNSFLALAEQNYFDETVCHRLTDYGIFVLQCGDPTATGRGGPGYTIPDEVSADLTYPVGTVAMANRGVEDSGGSQFFLVWADTELPPSYTVFGQMDQAGIEVVAGIAAQGVDADDGTSPIAEAFIKDVTLG